MDDNKIQKMVGAGSVLGILLMIAILFSNGTFGDGTATTAAASLDSAGIVQMDEGEEGQDFGEEGEEGQGYGGDEDEMDEGEDYDDEDEMDEDEDEDEDEMDEDEDEDEGGLLGFDFGFGLFGEKD